MKEATWEEGFKIKGQFPQLELEDKLRFGEGDINRTGVRGKAGLRFGGSMLVGTKKEREGLTSQ